MIDQTAISASDTLTSESGFPFGNQKSLKDLRRLMLKFATARLYDNHLAEDAVQEALIGAFSGQAGFSGKASFKTWTLGILKHKINDVLRTRCTQSEISLEYPHGEGNDVADLLNTTRPGGPSSQAACHPYHEPEQALSAGQFWTTFENALLDLPGMQADVFVKHELSALGIDEICGEMAISEGNFYVLMHRARKQLRSSMGHCRSVE